MTLRQKEKQDRMDRMDRMEYESLCQFANVKPLHKSVDWYWHFNELKTKIK